MSITNEVQHPAFLWAVERLADEQLSILGEQYTTLQTRQAEAEADAAAVAGQLLNLADRLGDPAADLAKLGRERAALNDQADILPLHIEQLRQRRQTVHRAWLEGLIAGCRRRAEVLGAELAPSDKRLAEIRRKLDQIDGFSTPTGEREQNAATAAALRAELATIRATTDERRAEFERWRESLELAETRARILYGTEVDGRIVYQRQQVAV